MIAHINFPVLTHNDALPATLSSAVIQGLLRDKLGYQGVIVSDCLEMRAVSDTFGTEGAAVLALEAGNDLVLVSHHYALQQGSFKAIKDAVKAGKLSPLVVQQAAERVLDLKARYLSWDDISVDIDYKVHAQLQDRAYELSTTLVRNEDALLPLHLETEENIVIVSPRRNTLTMVEDRYYADEMLLEIIGQYHNNVHLLPVTSDNYQQAVQGTRKNDIFIVATVNANLDEEQANTVRYLTSIRKRVIGIGVRNPYDLSSYPQLHTYLVTYRVYEASIVSSNACALRRETGAGTFTRNNTCITLTQFTRIPEKYYLTSNDVCAPEHLTE